MMGSAYYCLLLGKPERLFKSGYRPEWSYTKILIRFPHNSGDATRSTVLGYVSSYIRPEKMGQYPEMRIQLYVVFISASYASIKLNTQ
jgi:hypothetical protein